MLATIEAFQAAASADTVAPILNSAQLTIKRARDDSTAGTNCGPSGYYHVRVDASDDQTDARDLGFELTLVRGELPLALPQGPVIGTATVRDGSLSDAFVDDDREYDATVAIRVLDAAGNRSAPIEVHVSDRDVGGCSMGDGRGRQSASLVAALALLGFARRRCMRKKA